MKFVFNGIVCTCLVRETRSKAAGKRYEINIKIYHDHQRQRLHSQITGVTHPQTTEGQSAARQASLKKTAMSYHQSTIHAHYFGFMLLEGFTVVATNLILHTQQCIHKQCRACSSRK